MELVYLWVKEYKNIKRQGFNFSPRFECKYDENTEKLTINENKEYVSIFPKNINITAIVGENGSGKSSLLTGITNDKMIIEKNTTLYSNGFNEGVSDISFTPLDREKDYEIIYLDYDLINIEPVNTSWSYFHLNIYDKNLYKKIKNDAVGSMNFNIAQFQENFYNLIIEHINTFKSSIFFFNPIEIILSDYIHSINTKDNRFEYINELIKEVENTSLSKEKFLVFLYSQVSMQVSAELPSVDKLEEILPIEKVILEYAEYFKLGDIQSIYDFFDSLNEYQDKSKFIIEKFSTIYNEHKDAFLKLISIGYLQIDFNDEKPRKYTSLSHGERKLFTEMLMIYHEITETQKNDIFIVLDEPDLTLHPDWQRKYLNEMLKLLSNFPSKNFHLIITSHSPFILSDIPKENVVFLEKGKQIDVEINTFGANIHTLLSHGFFMDGGLMGEYAKEKIQSIIKYYEEIIEKDLMQDKNKQLREEEKEKYQKNNQKNFWNIQLIIGDDYLKQVIKNHLIEIEKIVLGQDESKNEEIKRLQAQIDLLAKS